MNPPGHALTENSATQPITAIWRCWRESLRACQNILCHAPTRCRQVSAIEVRPVLADCFHSLGHLAITTPPGHWTCRTTFHHNRLQRHDLTFQILVCKVAEGHVDCPLSNLDARYIVTDQLVRIRYARCGVV